MSGVNRLADLARLCLVRIGRDVLGTSDEGGSGVWVAPDLVLTCAHVVPEGLGAETKIAWQGHLLTGVVVDHTPNLTGAALWPFPDLAIVSVGNPPAHPCAWLSETMPIEGTKLIAFGHSTTLGEGLQQTCVVGNLSGWHNFGDGQFAQFKGNELVPGMSGGPVFDESNGAICAVVTTTLGEGADRGGYLAPVVGLRHAQLQRREALFTAHDQFHYQDRRWTVMRTPPDPTSLAPCPLEPDREVEMLGLLADFARTDPTEFAGLLGGTRQPSRTPQMLRDVAYELLDGGALRTDWIMPLLRLTNELAGERPETREQLRLYTWADRLSERHDRSGDLDAIRRSPSDGSAAGGIITVEIVPGASDVDHFCLSVAAEAVDGTCTSFCSHKNPTFTLEEAQNEACKHLRTALALLRGNALVEFVVPIDLFDEPFDELVPTKPFTNLGRKFQVVLRDYDRMQDLSVHHHWRRRWQRLTDPPCEIRWSDCAEEPTADQYSAELELASNASVVALSRSPSSDSRITAMLQVALDAGVPVMVWRRAGCAEHEAGQSGGICSGQRFRIAFEPVLNELPVSALPERVRLLRNSVVAQQNPAHVHPCRGTVLLWDNPERLAHRSPVQEPPYRPVEAP